MYVRVLTGRYAGEVRDIRADAAKQMLADGRAMEEDAPWPLFGKFATGGLVDSKPSIVGEAVTGSLLPAATVQKLKRAAGRSHG